MLLNLIVLAQIAKIMSEPGEAVQVIQKRGIGGLDLPEELADVVIRVCDLCGYLDIPLDDAVAAKMEKNKSRPYKHGKLC